jgi:PHD/YefM family antitoxin component YafN of YafNO toxin-antitoxin module
MLKLHPQFLNDSHGNKSMVVLSAADFEALMEQLEELEDIILYDEAKKEDTGERIPMAEAFKMIEEKRINKSR